jgi:cysteine desulfurase
MEFVTPIYMDYNATTPVDPRVLESMLPYFTSRFGNAASRTHTFGTQAAEAVELARGRLSRLIGARPDEIVFTSGATESNNLAIKGVLDACAEKGRHIVTCLTEHKSVLDVCRRLEHEGAEVTWLKPDAYGRVTAAQVEAALADRTVLVTLMAANNETGTLHPIAEIGKVTRARGVLLHTDATQAVGRLPIDVEVMGIDLLSLSAHKMYGPKGAGALYVRNHEPRVRLAPQIDGGGHERGLRSGTLNVPGIVGLGAAASLAAREMEAESVRLAGLRDRLFERLSERLDFVIAIGHPTERLPNTLSIAFACVEAEALIRTVTDVAVSTGSACTSAVLEPSHVLRAMGVPDDLVRGSIRLSLGRFTTQEDVDLAADRVAAAVTELRRGHPLYQMLSGAAAGQPHGKQVGVTSGLECDCGPGGCAASG